jgi:hypothetical protein
MFMLHLMYFETKVGIKNEEMMNKMETKNLQPATPP